MIERIVPDHIHGQIHLDRADFAHLGNDFAQRELARLKDLAHLGVISKLRRLARHDKLEHAYGTYWLCKQSTNNNPGLIGDKKAFRLAGLMHGIGHLPFSYDAERAVVKLYHIHAPTQAWLKSVFEKCVEFAGDSGVERAAGDMMSRMDFAMLHRWFGSLKIAQSRPDEFTNELGRQIVRILIDPDVLGHQLLQELDKLDYVLRDMFYLLIGRIELNFPPLLAQFDKSPDGKLKSPKLLKLIETSHDCLCDEVYLGPEERCLAQVMEKSLVKEVFEGRHTVEELLGMTDKDFEGMLVDLRSGSIDLEQIVRRIKDGKLAEVARVACDCESKSIAEVEAELAGTNKAGLHKYPQTKGIYVECVPNPYHAEVEAYELTDSGVSVGIAYDFDSACPHHVIGALIRAERWAPENWYGTELSCREHALRFLFGLRVQPRFDRYSDDVSGIIMRYMPKPEDEWQRELFYKDWRLREWAIFEALFYEYDELWPARHFLRFPEHWNTKLITDVLSSVDKSRRRKRPREERADYDKRAERLLEYSTYLQTVLRIREGGLSGWVLPSVLLLTEDGEQYAEVDVVAVYVPKAHSGPIKIELLEVSRNDSEDNREENRRKLNKIAQRVKERFGRKVCVMGYFNNRQVIAWPPIRQS